MKYSSLLAPLLPALLAYFSGFSPALGAARYDVVVYGATPGGVAAAVHAAREGAGTLLLQEDGHIGGLASGGLSNPDFRSFEALGGAYREFMQRIVRHYVETYGPDSQQVKDCVQGGYPEPRVARMVFEQMLGEAGVTVLPHHRLVAAEVEGTVTGRRIVAARFADLKGGGERGFSGRVFIDGTYEGDLMAAAGVPYRVGREGQREYGEELAPEETDHHVQAYNFRVVLTTDPRNQIPIERPTGYRRENYLLLIDWINQREISNIDQISQHILRVRRMPNSKAEFNDVRTAPMSLSRTGINNPWPEGDAAVRAGIFRQYKEWSLGLIYFLQNDSGVPAAVREEMRKWALPKDEFIDTGNWTPALYVREGRRMVGSYVFTEHDTGQEPNSVRSRLQPRSVAVTDYSINTHGIHSPAPGVHLGVISRRVRPLQVPYDIIVPAETGSLLVPVAVSASHVGFAALRYEPLWTALGQAAGVAAGQAVREGIEVREVDVGALQRRLHEQGAITIYVSDLGEPTDVPRPAWEQPSPTFRAWLHRVPPASPLFRPAQFFGTAGFFHGLVDPAEALDWNQGRSTGQWGLRMPYHTFDPDRPVDAALARDWLERAAGMGIETALTPERVIERGMTRGSLLLALYEDVERRAVR